MTRFRYSPLVHRTAKTPPGTLFTAKEVSMFKPLVVVLLLVLAFAFKACSSNQPQPKVTGIDLVGTSTNSTNTGCDEIGTNPNQQVQITVQNKGTVDAPPSVTSVTFSNVPNAITLNTPAIPANGSTKLLVPIPANCGGANCSATITINSDGAITLAPDPQRINPVTCIARIG